MPDRDGTVPERLRVVVAEDDLLTLVVVTLGASAEDATANLLAPVLVNHRTRKAAQVVLDDLELPIKAPLAAASA